MIEMEQLKTANDLIMRLECNKLKLAEMYDGGNIDMATLIRMGESLHAGIYAHAINTFTDAELKNFAEIMYDGYTDAEKAKWVSADNFYSLMKARRDEGAKV